MPRAIAHTLPQHLQASTPIRVQSLTLKTGQLRWGVKTLSTGNRYR